MTAWYNEIDPFAAAWLRKLIAGGHIAPGVVDERDIRDVRPDEIRDFTQCHFFAGIGVWSYALRRAGWPDSRPVWTGSCPCQPFSAAGAGGGFADERHLWPHFHHLIEQCRPVSVLGEQVASKDGLAWIDLVQADLEGAGYAAGAVDLCAAGVGAPHIRQRLWWVGERLEHPAGDGRSERWPEPSGRGVASGRSAGRLADNDDAGLEGRGGMPERPDQRAARSSGMVGRVADANGRDAGAERQQLGREQRQQPQNSRVEHCGPAGPVNGFWRASDWLFCRDGKWRQVEPGTFPLVDGAPARVGRLRGYGNAINAEAATCFIEAVTETFLGVRRLA